MRLLFVFYDVTNDARRTRAAGSLRSDSGQWLQRSAWAVPVGWRSSADLVVRSAGRHLDRGDRLLACAPCPDCTEHLRFLPVPAGPWVPGSGVRIAGGEATEHPQRPELRVVRGDGPVR